MLSQRYNWLKLTAAAEEFLVTLATSRNGIGKPLSLSEALSVASAKAREAYEQKLTTVMYMAGSSMCPSLNKKAIHDKTAVEKLVVRRLQVCFIYCICGTVYGIYIK